MKLKRISALVLSLVLTAVNSNIIFCTELETVDTEITAVEEAALSDSAIETEITNADFASTSTTVSYAVTGGNIYFDTSTGTITDCDTSVTKAVIPGEIEGVAVNSVGDNAFSYCSRLIMVNLPNSIVSINNYAFSGCSSLESIDLSDNLTSIGAHAFESCSSLPNIDIPDGITNICEDTFFRCSRLTSITLPDNLISIGSAAFDACDSLINVNLPDSLVSIGAHAFALCSSLTNITFSDNLTYIGDSAFNSCSGLTSITLPDNLTSIGTSAFNSCNNLTSIVIPDSIAYIGSAAFDNCSNLKYVYCYKGSKADNSSFYPKGITIVYLGNTAKISFSVAGGNIYFDSLTGTVTDCDSSITEAVIPSEIEGISVTSIGEYAFAECSNLTNITFSDNINYIGNYAFYYCSSLVSITIPNGITTIYDHTFSYCGNLTSVNLPNSITYIGKMAFICCASLTSITLPNSITYIEDYAFKYCYSLKHINLPNSITYIGNGIFDTCRNLTSITLPDNLISIGNRAFYDCSLTSIILPDSLISIGDYAFYSCNLTSITLPNGITSIGDYVFYDCYNLSSITFPSELESIGNYAFYICGNLKKVTLPDTLTSIGDYAFCKCAKLTNITIPKSIRSINNSTFKSCTKLSSVTLPDSLNFIDDYAFYDCESLISINLSDSLISIGDYAFYDCYCLPNITILDSITNIGSNAFYGCSALETVYCYKNSAADDSSLYPNITEIVYLGDSKNTTTETTTEVTTEITTAEPSSEVTTEGEPVAKPTFKVVGVFGGRSVTFTSETDGAVIYYSSSTSNLTTDDICIANGETVTYEDYYGTIYARAYYNGVWSDVNKFVLKIPVVNTPTVTASGSVVTIKSTTPSSFICYTTDGTAPVVETDGTVTNGAWLKVNGARTNSGTVTANPGDTVTAVAVRSCFTTSETASAYVSVSPAEFKVVGTFGGRNVTFTSATSGVKIYYSSTTSSLTTSDKCISNGETVLFEDFYGTIYARAYYNGKWSNVSRLILKIPTINDPTITYSGGKATIRTTTPNCYIYYTTDGSTPSISNGKKLCSNSYGQISVSSGTTVKAIAVRSCFTNSSVASYKVS